MITLERILIKYLPEYIIKFWDKMLPGHKKPFRTYYLAEQKNEADKHGIVLIVKKSITVTILVKTGCVQNVKTIRQQIGSLNR